MWGDDYPHAEGTWPHTREAMRFTFSDIDQRHVRQYLGDTAIDVYGLDRPKLEAVAAEIGPTVDGDRHAVLTRPRTRRSASTRSAPGRGSSHERRHRLQRRAGPVTAEEVDHLHELGWVKLKAFVDPDVVGGMLDLAREAMGDDADSNPIPPGFEQAAADGEFGLDYFNAHRSFGMSNPVLRPLIDEVGQERHAAAAPVARRGEPMGVRYYSDFFVPKLPSVDGVAARRQRSHRVPPGLHHLRGRPVRRA